MAFSYISDDGELIVPGAYSKIQVAPNTSGLASSGIIMLVGESESGPSYADEGTDLYKNLFGPDQKADVITKYGSGPLVDAYQALTAASADSQITGQVNRVLFAKTNTSAKATSTLTALDSTTYGILTASAGGAPGNLILRTVTAKPSEVIPTTGSFILATPSLTTTVNFRVNGGAVVGPASLAAADSPTTMVATINALSGVAATGGASRGTIANTVSVVLTHDSGYAAHLTGTFTNMPVKNDILIIPTGSAFATANEGTYWVSSVSTGRIDIYKLIDAAAATQTAPTTETVTAAPADIVAYSPVVISLEAGNPSIGLGKSLEIAETSTGSFSTLCFQYPDANQPVGSVPTAASFVSTTASPYVITSSAEYGATISLVRQTDATNQAIDIESSVILTLGYKGTTASAVISGTTMTLTLAGGGSSGLSPLTVNLKSYRTVADLCQYLNTLTDFSAAPALASKGSIYSVNLDDGTYTFATDKGAKTGRIKADGYLTAQAITNQSNLVTLTPNGTATKLPGMPAAVAGAFLSGGTKGATTNATIQGALDALKTCRGNFLVPLFSTNAADDIANDATDAASTYDITSINAACKSHVLSVSTLKQSRYRQAFLSYWDTFDNCMNASSNTSHPRCTMVFQKVITTNASGVITTFKPWMTAVLAAAMKAAGNYRDITGKFINISGIVDPTSYSNQNITSEEKALKAGLLPIIHEEDGGYTWVSDQTTYTVDGNFFFNSTTAVYNGDIVALTAQKRMGLAFKGQSLADAGAESGKTVLKAILDDLRAAKWIAPSQDAPKGYKEPVVKILNGNVMACSCEIKISTGIKFIPISFLVTPITDSTG